MAPARGGGAAKGAAGRRQRRRPRRRRRRRRGRRRRGDGARRTAPTPTPRRAGAGPSRTSPIKEETRPRSCGRTALLAAQQDDSELAALLEEDKEEEAPSVPAPAAPAPLKRERSTRTTTPRYVKKEMSEKELSLKDHIGGVAARRIDALYDRLGDVTAKLPVVLDDLTEGRPDASIVLHDGNNKSEEPAETSAIERLEDLAAVAGINVPGQLRLEELSVRCHEHRASEESVRHGNQKKKLEDIQHPRRDVCS